jgi:hypothetical protein
MYEGGEGGMGFWASVRQTTAANFKGRVLDDDILNSMSLLFLRY